MRWPMRAGEKPAQHTATPLARPAAPSAWRLWSFSRTAVLTAIELSTSTSMRPYIRTCWPARSRFPAPPYYA